MTLRDTTSTILDLQGVFGGGLGGQWGQLAEEEKFQLFDRAILQTIQKADESNDPYLTRHDNASEELLNAGVKEKTSRAYTSPDSTGGQQSTGCFSAPL